MIPPNLSGSEAAHANLDDDHVQPIIVYYVDRVPRSLALSAAP